LDDLLQRVQNVYANFTTMEADIYQINHFTQFDQNVESRGAIFVQGNSFVIEYTYPVYQFIKFHDDVITMFSREENIGIITRDGTDAITNVFNFQRLLSSRFNFIEMEGNHAIFTTDISIEGIVDLRVGINIRFDRIDRISYTDDMGNLITIMLNSQVFNQPLSRELNSFVIPIGTTVIQDDF
jgi:outer membrane lipoprotein-sorting protein